MAPRVRIAVRGYWSNHVRGGVVAVVLDYLNLLLKVNDFLELLVGDPLELEHHVGIVPASKSSIKVS